MPALVLDHHDTSTVRYVYATDVIKTRNGKEWRHALMSKPREFHEFSTVLDDVEARVLRGQMLHGITNGTAFSIAVQSEALAIRSYSGAVLTVATTNLSDWVANGATVVFTAMNGYRLQTTVASFTATTITLSATPTANLVGAVIVPMQALQFDDAQQFGRWAVNMQRLDAKGEAVTPATLTGAGATLTMHDGLPVFDRGVSIEDMVAEALIAMTERIDFGILQTTSAVRTVSDWARTISYTFNKDAERQWIKKLFATCKGRQKLFLLPTGTPDLTVHTQPTSTALRIHGPPTAGATDYTAQWFQSLAHRRLMIVTNLTVLYRNVVASVDNADGTQTLTLNSAMNFAIDGYITRISLLEQCRFDEDEMRLTYSTSGGKTQLQARVVQQ